MALSNGLAEEARIPCAVGVPLPGVNVRVVSVSRTDHRFVSYVGVGSACVSGYRYVQISVCSLRRALDHRFVCGSAADYLLFLRVMDGLLTYCVGSGVVEEKDLVDCKEGEAGELLVQGPGVFAGTLFSFICVCTYINLYYVV